MSVIKSPNDNREYKSIVLPNKLNVILISDPEMNVAAASLCVNIGNYNDPIKYQGLAHFLEHMLFMGSKKYKDENYYFEYLNEHGGTSNAYTSSEITNYFFDVNAEYFDKALDIFSRFFIDPLFKKETVDREIEAVNSEHSKNYSNDLWRENRLLKHLAKSDHPYNKFSTGNKSTLSNSVRDKLIEFYNKYYSANLMNLVILWNKPIEYCEKLVTETFGLVENNDVVRKKYNGKPFNTTKREGLCYKLVKSIPINNINKLIFYWQLPNVDKYFKRKPLHYISYLLGHEQIHSAYGVLKKKGLITSLDVSSDEKDDNMCIYNVSIELTDMGYEHVPYIIETVYKYINTIKTKGIKKWIYNEMKTINDIAFEYLDKIPPIDYVSILSVNMVDYPIKYAVYLPFMYRDYTKTIKKIIKYLFKYIVPRNSIIHISSPNYKNDKSLNQTEQYYNIKYGVVDYPMAYGNEFIAYNKNKHINITIPKKNKLIPKNTDILKYNMGKNPVKYENDNGIEIWYKKDNTFKKPRIMVSLNIYVPNLLKTPRHEALYSMYIDYIKYILNSYIYYMQIADSALFINIADDSIIIGIDAYTDVITKILTRLTKTIFHTKIHNDIYVLIKNKYRADLENFIFNTPVFLSNEYLRQKVYKKYNTYLAILDILDSIKYKEILNIPNWLKNKSNTKCVLYGNIDDIIIQSIVKRLDTFKSPYNKKIKNIVRAIDEGDTEIFMKNMYNPLEKDSIINLMYEIGSIQRGITNEWDTKLASLMLVHKILNEKFFDQLRTVEQTGYIVKCLVTMVGNWGYPTYGLLYMIQSSKKNPYELRKRIRTFVNDSYTYIKNMSYDKYMQYVDSLIGELKKTNNNMADVFSQYCDEIYCNKVVFNIKQHYATVLKSITHDQLCDYYEKYFIGSNKKIRIVEMYRSLFKSAKKNIMSGGLKPCFKPHHDKTSNEIELVFHKDGNVKKHNGLTIKRIHYGINAGYKFLLKQDSMKKIYESEDIDGGSHFNRQVPFGDYMIRSCGSMHGDLEDGGHIDEITVCISKINKGNVVEDGTVLLFEEDGETKVYNELTIKRMYFNSDKGYKFLLKHGNDEKILSKTKPNDTPPFIDDEYFDTVYNFKNYNIQICNILSRNLIGGIHYNDIIVSIKKN